MSSSRPTEKIECSSPVLIIAARPKSAGLLAAAAVEILGEDKCTVVRAPRSPRKTSSYSVTRFNEWLSWQGENMLSFPTIIFIDSHEFPTVRVVQSVLGAAVFSHHRPTVVGVCCGEYAKTLVEEDLEVRAKTLRGDPPAVQWLDAIDHLERLILI